MRVLDEVADAMRIARGGLTVPVHSSVVLAELFVDPITPQQWSTMQSHLGCPLPAFEFDQGHWFRADEFQTVWEIVAHVAKQRHDWESPIEQSIAAWRNAQVFAGVRAAIAEAGNLDQEEVIRSARLKRDLNFD